MRARKQRRKKGDVTLMFLAIVIAVVLTVALVGGFIGNYFSFFYKAVNIKAKINIYMVNDDMGTELVSLLNARTAAVKHIELLGMYTTDGISESKAAYMDPIITTMNNSYANYDFSFSGPRPVSFQKGVPVQIQDSTKSSIVGCGTTAPDNITLRWPSDSKTISSGFGGRELKTKSGQCDCHGGIDIAGDGMNVYAAACGTVKSVYRDCKEDLGSKSKEDIENKQNCNNGYGNWVVVEHKFGPNTYYTYYYHLKTVNVAEKARVGCEGNENNAIGISGWTGYTEPSDSKGAHLHFELRFNLRNPDKLPQADRDSVNPCGLFKDMAGVTGRCEHAQVAACKYVSGTISSTAVSSYETDVPLPGAKSGTPRGTVVLKQWG